MFAWKNGTDGRNKTLQFKIQEVCDRSIKDARNNQMQKRGTFAPPERISQLSLKHTCMPELLLGVSRFQIPVVSSFEEVVGPLRSAGRQPVCVHRVRGCV